MRTHLPAVASACAVLLLAPGPAAVAAPAPAAGTADLAIRLRWATLPDAAQKQVATEVRKRVATATVTNRGPAAARGVRLRVTGQVDGEAVNPRSIWFCPHSRPNQSQSPPTTAPSLVVPISDECALPDLPPGRSLDLATTVVQLAIATGVVGRLTMVVSHAGIDPVPNNAATAALGLPPADGTAPFDGVSPPDGPDLYAGAWDGPVDAAGGLAAVAPGRTGDVRFEIGNRGTRRVDGITVTVRLPRQVTFAEDRAGCVYDAGRRIATCGYPALQLAPAEDDASPYDRVFSALRFRYLVRVSPAAPAPATLTGGRLTVEPMAAGLTAPTGGAQIGTPPAGALPAEATGLRAVEFDAADNRDDFAVLTTLGGADGGSGGLPTTGVPGGLLAGLGLGGVAIGSALFLLARRRRTALVAPSARWPAGREIGRAHV